MKRPLLSVFSFATTFFFSMLSATGWGQTTITQTYTTSGSWNVPCGVTSLQVECWGGGGGGAGDGVAGNDGSGGGGGGGYVISTISVTPGTTIPYTIGAGGTAGANSNPGGNGGAGGNTTFSSITANGGQGGINNGAGGTGGGGSGGTVTSGVTGGAGTPGGSGAGGAGANGGAGGAEVTSDGNGLNGITPGGGGSGGYHTSGGRNSGGTGAAGQIRITYTITPAGADQTLTACATTTTLAGTSAPAGTTGTWTVSPVGPVIVNPNSPVSDVTGLVPGTVYIFTWTISAGGCTSPPADQVVITAPAGPGCQVYCTPSPGYSSATAGYISNVNISSGAVDQTSGWSGGLNDYTGTCVNMGRGQSYPVSVTVTHSAAVTAYYNLWVDWNGDGVFEAGEVTPLGSGTTTQTISRTLTVPCDAGIGNVRMRVVFQYNSNPSDPCITNSIYGETEDYCINIVADTPPVANAGPDQSITCTSSGTMAATPVVAPNTGVWTLISGSGSITDPTSPATTVTGLSSGANVFRWATFGTCGSDADTVVLNVSGLPVEPVHAGSDIYTCLSGTPLYGSDPAPFTGQWVVTAGPGGSSFTPSDADHTATINGLTSGVYTLEWRVNTGGCGIISDAVQIIQGSLPTPDAGPDQTICPAGAILSANDVSGVTGTWSFVSGPVTPSFVDVNDPNTTVYNLTATGVYVLRWSFTGGGCPGSVFDDVSITVNSCINDILHSSVSDQTVSGCNFRYMDSGGAGGNYDNNTNHTRTTICPDAPGQYVTINFSSISLSIDDYLIIFDDSNPAAPIVGYGTGATMLPSNTITSSTGCLIIDFYSTAVTNSSGWMSTTTCSTTAGTQYSGFCNLQNCSGGCGQTMCADGSIVVPQTNSNTSPRDINNGLYGNNGCLGSGEDNSTWVYFDVAGSGTIEFTLSSPGGQDWDYAIWGPYSQLSCPANTRDAPIRSSWAANGGASPCGTTIGVGATTDLGAPVSPLDVCEGGTCSVGNVDGWTYKIDALAGEIYVMMIQNYANNSSTVDVAFTGTAVFDCDPVTPLPVTLNSLWGHHDNHQRVNVIDWITEAEINNDYFTVEASPDAINWKVVGTLPGAGNSNIQQSYRMVDPYYYPLTYYRLKQTDYDGQYKYYGPVSVKANGHIGFGTGMAGTNVYPNPSAGIVNIKLPEAVSADIMVHDLLGRVVFKQQTYGQENSTIDLGSVARGVYIIKIETILGVHIQQIILE